MTAAMSHHLIVLPDDTGKPIVDAIDGASRSLNIRMFLFTDATLLAAVCAAQQRGVTVRVMLNPARRNGESENEEARHTLLAAGVEVRDSNPAFALTHQKSMVVDNRIGFVESLNWEPRDLTKTRDYAIVTSHAHEVEEMVACFEADWAHQDFAPRSRSTLVWCPNNGRQRMAAFIDATRHSLWLQNERYQDQVIIERLVRAVTRGVQVHILTKPPHTLKPDKLIEGVGGLRILQDVGAKVHTLKHLKLHAKMMLADGKRALVGSINIAPGSFDARRELAIETEEPDAVKRLEQTAKHDWKSSHALDLSDAALIADLKKRKGLNPEQLVLYEDSEHWGYHHHGGQAAKQGGKRRDRA
jgi:phosphatidylserine/phosphatidylglycerophosphate/cardiolipin synthase-like enzyme